MSLSDWDLSLANGHREELLVLGDLTGVSDGTIEVKSDSRAVETRHVYIEYKQFVRGTWKWSGIAVTRASRWAIRLPQIGVALFVPTVRVKALAREAILQKRTAPSNRPGDIPTLGARVRLNDLINDRRPAA